MAMWVDDYFAIGTKNFLNVLTKRIGEEFTIGQTLADNLKYLGISIYINRDGSFLQYQKNQVSKLQAVDLPEYETTKDQLKSEGLTALRQGTGKLNWAAYGTRPDLSFTTTELSTHLKGSQIQQFEDD